MPGLSAAVRSLVIANSIVFAIGLLLPQVGARTIDWFAFWFPRHENFGVWQVVTYMFLHGGIAHILFNMFALVSFGVLLERLWGTRRFLVFYFLCGIGAGIVQTGVSWIAFQIDYSRLTEAGVTPDAINDMLKTGRYTGIRSDRVINAATDLYQIFASPMLGASGAIYGILLAFGLLFPNAKLALLFLPIPIAAKYFIPIVLALDLFSGVTGFSLFGGGVAHFAHIGGALIGFLLMWHWRNQARHKAPDGVRLRLP
jgi:membrane associated rhomboid family serine protease